MCDMLTFTMRNWEANLGNNSVIAVFTVHVLARLKVPQAVRRML